MLLRLLLPLLLRPLILFTSCVEGEEEIWINPDASGHLVVHYELPSAALAQLGNPADLTRALRMIDEKEDGIEITALTFEVQGFQAIFHLAATFKDARKLLEIAERSEEILAAETGSSPEQMNSVSGEIDFAIKGLTPTFNRVISLEGIFPAFVSPSMLKSSNFKYTIHLPAEVKQTNAHTISADRRTVSWTFLLKEHFSEPMEMSFTTELPIPWWVWLILSLLVFAIAWLIWRKVLRP